MGSPVVRAPSAGAISSPDVARQQKPDKNQDVGHVEVPARCWTTVSQRHPSTRLEPASTATLCHLAEDGLCSVISGALGTVTC